MRKVQPENVMLVPDQTAAGGERVKILDFGIAKLAMGMGQPGAMPTRTGVLMGTDQAFSLFRRDRLSGSARYLIQDRQCWDEACDIDYELCDMSG